MLSKITIEVDFANNNMPIIRLLVRNSDDIRDKLLKQFIYKLPSQSAWCKIQFINGMPETSVNYDAQQYSITPLTVDDLKPESELMLKYHQTIFSNVKKTPDDEYVCMELRDEENRIRGINIFLNGEVVHTWTAPELAM
jgi:hypothetical protein